MDERFAVGYNKFLDYVIANTSAKLVCGLAGISDGHFIGGRERPESAPIFKGGKFTTKLDFRYSESIDNIWKKSSDETKTKLSEYLKQYGIELSLDGTVSIEISEQELNKANEEALAKAKEIVPKYFEKGSNYAFEKFNESEYTLYIRDTLDKRISKNGIEELSKEAAKNVMISNAAYEAQAKFNVVKEYSFDQFLESLTSQIEQNEANAIVPWFRTEYHKPYDHDRVHIQTETVADKNYNKYYYRLKNIGATLEEFVMYAKDKGYNIRLDQHINDAYLYIEDTNKITKNNEELEQGFLNEKQKLENEERMKQVQSLSQMEGYRR